MALAFGIDFGSSTSLVAAWKNGSVDIISPENQGRRIPSYVAFRDGRLLIGEDAKAQVSRNATNTVFSIKRLVGADPARPEVQNIVKHWPFKVMFETRNRTVVSVEHNKQGHSVTLPQIVSYILGVVKDYIFTHLPNRPGLVQAVLAVPGHYYHTERLLIKEAGRLAGLELAIVNESTALALAYAYKRYATLPRGPAYHILLYNLGASCLDVALVRMEDGVLEVLAHSGIPYLGGEDFDNRLLDHFVQEFKRRYGHDISGNHKAVMRLRAEVEKAKATLSTVQHAAVEVDALHEGLDFHTALTRDKFESICSDLLGQCLLPVQSCLKEAGVDKASVDDVVIVGGCTRIPKVQHMLSELFSGKDLSRILNADEGVAYGAALRAAMIAAKEQNLSLEERLARTMPLDVTTHALGVEVFGGAFHIVVPKNSSLPIRKTATFTTAGDYQTAAQIKLYEGESMMCRTNKQLAKVDLDGIPALSRGRAQIDVCIEISALNEVTLSVTNRSTGAKVSQGLTWYQLVLVDNEPDNSNVGKEILPAETSADLMKGGEATVGHGVFSNTNITSPSAVSAADAVPNAWAAATSPFAATTPMSPFSPGTMMGGLAAGQVVVLNGQTYTVAASPMAASPMAAAAGAMAASPLAGSPMGSPMAATTGQTFGSVAASPSYAAATAAGQYGAQSVDQYSAGAYGTAASGYQQQTGWSGGVMGSSGINGLTQAMGNMNMQQGEQQQQQQQQQQQGYGTGNGYSYAGYQQGYSQQAAEGSNSRGNSTWGQQQQQYAQQQYSPSYGQQGQQQQQQYSSQQYGQQGSYGSHSYSGEQQQQQQYAQQGGYGQQQYSQQQQQQQYGQVASPRATNTSIADANGWQYQQGYGNAAQAPAPGAEWSTRQVSGTGAAAANWVQSHGTGAYSPRQMSASGAYAQGYGNYGGGDAVGASMQAAPGQLAGGYGAGAGAAAGGYKGQGQAYAQQPAAGQQQGGIQAGRAQQGYGGYSGY